MIYSTTFDGWHGDEHLCFGNCGLCQRCQENDDNREDEAYATWRDNQLFSDINFTIIGG